MSPPHKIGDGLIQGGGIDLFWYVYFTALLFAEVLRTTLFL